MYGSGSDGATGRVEIGVVQMSLLDGQVERNLETAMSLIAGAPGAQLYLLPELFTTGYAHDSWQRAGEQYPAVVGELARLAENTGAVICGSLIAVDSGCLFNRMVAVLPGTRRPVVYDKIHLFGLMKEDAHLRPGRKVSVFEHLGVGFGMAICYDLRFPAMFQQMAPPAKVILVASEWPEPRCETMILMARARAAENQCYVVLSNRCGSGADGTVFCGHSMAIGPDGSIMADTATNPRVLRVRIVPDDVMSARAALDVFKDRVPGIDAR